MSESGNFSREIADATLLAELNHRMVQAQIQTDLVTCLEVCNAMALKYFGSGLRGGTKYFSVIRQVDDIRHVVMGSTKLLSWYTVKAMCELDDADFGPDWPDVRRCMAELIGRLEGRDATK